jgi:hypothetical protein
MLSFPDHSINRYLAQVAPTSPDFICYVQFSDQRVVDLSTLCGGRAIAVKRDVVVTELQVSGDRLVGQVRNDTGQTLQRIIVNYEVLGQSAKETRYTDFSFVDPERLEPGQIGAFTGTLNHTGQVRVIGVEWW